jgi:putative ABC transport system permease protein
MNSWLDGFPYRIQLRWWLLATGGLLALLVALITIGVMVGKAARANPAVSLRYE